MFLLYYVAVVSDAMVGRVLCPLEGSDKLMLGETTKLNPMGAAVRESIYLVLAYDSHTWKKIKKSKVLKA